MAKKTIYEAPAMQVVELSSENTICSGSNYEPSALVWILSGSSMSSSDEWSRGGYGSMDTIIE